MPGRTRWRRWYPSICSRRSTKIAGCSGRGPTTFMSPSSTLNSCGSSSRRTFRSRRPIGVTRASSAWAHTCRPPLLESTRIVRNLYIVNGLPPRSTWRRVLPPARDRPRRSSPTRAWVKSTGPRDVSLISAAMTSITGSVRTIPTIAAAMLRQRRLRRSRSMGPSGARCRRERQRRAHRLHELATNREAEAGAGEVVAQVRGTLAERLVQRLEGAGVVPAARVAHRELEPVPVEGTRRDLDGARVGELDGVGGKVEQHARERAGMPDAALRHRVHQPHLEPFLLGERQDHRSEERRVGKECRSRWSPYH